MAHAVAEFAHVVSAVAASTAGSHAQAHYLTFTDAPISRIAYTNFRRVVLERAHSDAMRSIPGAFTFPPDDELTSMYLRSQSRSQGRMQDELDLQQVRSLYAAIINEAHMLAARAATAEMLARCNSRECLSEEEALTIAWRAVTSPYQLLHKRADACASADSSVESDILALLRETDFTSNKLQRENMIASQRHEDEFATFLRDVLHIKLTTQAEIIARNPDARNTPDILFEDQVYVNGARCYWIDFKAYCGAPVFIITKKTRAQARKYTEAFGPGVICYMHGFVSGLPYSAISARALRTTQ